ncbi:MAG: hypothetical protein H6765_06000 [Candidatus Peribacteria bacterium]|nr:MAG: hypothetical protein H6765_06000 [Candidatus Peribacteria bacterium]
MVADFETCLAKIQADSGCIVDNPTMVNRYKVSLGRYLAAHPPVEVVREIPLDELADQIQ